MTKKLPYTPSDNGSISKQMPQGNGALHDIAPPGAWRLADLVDLSVDAPDLLEQLRSIHQSARQVIGGNLRSQSLDRSMLERLEASVLRQAGQVRLLQRKFIQAGTSGPLQDELAELREFFAEARAEIARQLKPAH
ncbi:hypothetical protein [Rubellimicrobium roseum]|uniref:Uncharacterized protein n=1 Tax=Rubellimicrobium roseum TaxID=687525 RepID=A0A5C4N8N9_9RHOB|nr:hypothetical protein [Rubellimicrobium roseum]TNC61407.1 hypothetical protein FHG71_21145 [Rubellimicrobium roseum]